VATLADIQQELDMYCWWSVNQELEESGVVRMKQDLQSVLDLPVHQKTTLYTIAAHIMSRLAPSLVSGYCLWLVALCLYFYV